ncbi:MAG: hypothetical protein WBA92_15935 [Pseudorhodobacter sp.]
MKRFLTFILLSYASVISAEVVVTTDGRSIDLKSDGTFAILEKVQEIEVPVSQQDPYFVYAPGKYGDNKMRFMPIVKNESEKTIVGFKFTSVFTSAFGDEIFSFSGESAERIEPGKTSTADTFYFFEDNQFIPGEPFDTLKIFEASGTGKVSTFVTAVVYSDGEIVKSK